MISKQRVNMDRYGITDRGIELAEISRSSSFEQVALATTVRDPRGSSNDLALPELGQSSTSLDAAPSLNITIPKGSISLRSRTSSKYGSESVHTHTPIDASQVSTTSSSTQAADNGAQLSLTEEEAEALYEAYNETYKFHPRHWTLYKRCGITLFYSLSAILVNISITAWVTSLSTIQKKFGGSEQHVLLGQSLFIIGTALGPYVLAPISDLQGRKLIYVFSLSIYSVLNLGLAFSPNLGMLIAFMFLAGLAGSTPLCLGAAIIADLFGSLEINYQAMATFVVANNVGPSLGSPIGAWICDNPHLGFRWIFLFAAVFGLALAFANLFIPETLPKIVIRKSAPPIPNNADSRLVPGVLFPSEHVLDNKRMIATMVGQILISEPTLFILAILNGFAYGLMFLFLQAAPKVYINNHDLSGINADLTYLSFTVSVLAMFLTGPLQTWLCRLYQEKHHYSGPEGRLVVAAVVVWIFPVSILWFSLTSGRPYSIWLSIVAGGVFGFANPILWNAMLTYVTDIYIGCAASAVAAFQIPSFLITAAFPPLGLVLFDKLSVLKACGILTGVSLPLCFIVYIVFRWGEEMRYRSLMAFEDHRRNRARRNEYESIPMSDFPTGNDAV